MNLIPDDQLLEQAAGGDADAFAALYRRHRDWVHRLAWRFTGNEQDALDILQETFIYLLQKLPGFRLTASMTTGTIAPSGRSMASRKSPS